jgi:hydrogenase nickel incorporation protein HypA/HybF
MHELGITRNVVAICAQWALASGAAVRVSRITLEIGKLAGVMPEALRFCFDICAQGSVVEGAELEIIEIAGRARCIDCAQELALAQPFGRCSCGSTNLQLIAGEELNIKEMDVKPCAQPAAVLTPTA